MRKISIFFLLLFTVLTLSACTSKDGSIGDVAGAEGKSRRPDFGQPKTRSDVMGVVKSTIGNEITVYTIERPERKERTAGGDEKNSEEGNDEAEKKAPSSRSQMMGGRGGMRGTGGASGSTEAKVAAMKKMSTGEDKLIIPVGIKMLKNEDGEMVEASLADVTRDKIITVWLNSEVTDRKIAEFVIVN